MCSCCSALENAIHQAIPGVPGWGTYDTGRKLVGYLLDELKAPPCRAGNSFNTISLAVEGVVLTRRASD